MFLVFLLVAIFVAPLQGEGSGLYLHGAEYAPSYDNYEPHDYKFEYGVSDPHTGDHKSQWETKENGVVKGGYSLLEADGTTRIVEYIADDHGFRAVVKKLGTSIHPQVETHGHVDVAPITPVAIPDVPVHHSYDGQVDNYAHVIGAAVKHLEPQSYIQPIEIPHTEEYHGYQQHIPTPYQIPGESQGYASNLHTVTSGYGHGAPQIAIPQSPPHYAPQPQQIVHQNYETSLNHQQPLYAPQIAHQNHEISLNHQQPLYAPQIAHQNHEISLNHQQPHYAPQIAHQNHENPLIQQQPLYAPQIVRQNHEAPLIHQQPQPLYHQNILPQKSYELPQSVHSHQNLIVQPQAQGVINQHYQPISEQYHGITGNPDDDSAYVNYNDGDSNNYGYYQGEYSQKVVRSVAPPKSKPFLINVQ